MRLAPVALRRARAMPRRAALSPSVPQELKMISLSLAPKSWAMVRRAWSNPAWALRPTRWMLDGLP